MAMGGKKIYVARFTGLPVESNYNELYLFYFLWTFADFVIFWNNQRSLDMYM